MRNAMGPDFDDKSLEAAIEAVRGMEVPAIPQDRLLHRLRGWNQPSQVPQPAPPPRRRRVISWTWLAPIAATLILGIGSLVWMATPSAASSFATVVQNARKAKSVQGRTSSRLGEGPAIEGRFFMEGNKIRQELAQGALTIVVNLDQNQVLYLNNPAKLSQRDSLADSPPQHLVDPVGQMAQASSAGASRLGEELLGSRQTQVFRVQPVKWLGIEGNAVMTVWVDAKMGLPLKITVEDTDPQHESEIRFEDLVWDAPIDPKQFALDAPQGYQKGEIVTTRRGGLAKPSTNQEPTLKPWQGDGAHGWDFQRAVGRIVWSKTNRMMVLLRDPESVSLANHRPQELVQLEPDQGTLLWKREVAGTSTLIATPQGEKLITVIGREIQIRSAEDGSVQSTLVNPDRPGFWAVSPDGTHLALTIAQWNRKEGPKGGFHIWDLTAKRIITQGTEEHPTTLVAYSPDGKRLVTSSNMGNVRLYDAETGKLAQVFPGIQPAVFSPDGSELVMGSMAKRQDLTSTHLMVVSIHGGNPRQTLTGTPGNGPSTPLGAAFSPDGKRIAAVDWNGKVSVWEAQTGKLDPTPRSHPKGVLSLAFSPDGQILATGGEDGTLRLWRLTAPKK